MDNLPDSVEKYGDLALRDMAALFRYDEESMQVFYMISIGYNHQELLAESNLEEDEFESYIESLEERNILQENIVGGKTSYELTPKGDYFREGIGELLDGYDEFAAETLFLQSGLDPEDREDIDKLEEYTEQVSGAPAEVIDEALEWARNPSSRDGADETSSSAKDAIDEALEDF